MASDRDRSGYSNSSTTVGSEAWFPRELLKQDTSCPSGLRPLQRSQPCPEIATLTKEEPGPLFLLTLAFLRNRTTTENKDKHDLL